MHQHRSTTAVQPVSIFLLFLLGTGLWAMPVGLAQGIDLFSQDRRDESISLFETSPEQNPTLIVEDEPHHQDSSDAPGFLIERGEGPGLSSSLTPIRLPYERRGSSMMVPARIGSHDVYFLFDTGASYTTLTSAFAALIGASPRANAPNVVVQTAGGLVETEFSLLNHLTLGTQRLEHISFIVCDPCGGFVHQGRPVVGLLGLNVLRRYRVSFDDTAGLIELHPHAEFSDRSSDIEPWIESELTDFRLAAGSGTRAIATLSLRNFAHRSIRDLVIELECTTLSGEIRQARTSPAILSARGTAETTASLDVAGCLQLQPRLLQARW